MADSATFLHLELAVENGTGGLAPGGLARPLTWQVEYPGQDPEAQKDKLVWEIQVSERDVRALVPLVQVGTRKPDPPPPRLWGATHSPPFTPQELEILNTALLTGVPRSVPVKLVMVEAGGGVTELPEPPGCESADKQVLQVSVTPRVPPLSPRPSRAACSPSVCRPPGFGCLRRRVRGGQGEPWRAGGAGGFLVAAPARFAALHRLGAAAAAARPAG